MGALCHDLGHIPFSHGAEELLPQGYHHEHLSVDVILSDELTAVWRAMTPPIKPRDVAKVAVGLKAWPFEASDFSPWDELMTEIVTGNAFGVDRIDYLLRDSHHAGVGYGRFDHHRLVDSLRILRWNDKPVIGIERGGMHAAEGLQLARYFMFEQLYFHRVRRALDLHLRHFLREWLPGGTYPIAIPDHLALTDNEVLAAMRKAAGDPASAGHVAAKRILRRDFYRVLYSPSAEDRNITLKPTEAIYRAAVEEFGPEFFAKDTHLPEAKPMEFAVETDFDEVVVSSVTESQVLGRIPAARYDFVFVATEKRKEAKRWLDRKRIRGILGAAVEEET
jgi:HD superfamily phosphohydrolase